MPPLELTSVRVGCWPVANVFIAARVRLRHHAQAQSAPRGEFVIRHPGAIERRSIQARGREAHIDVVARVLRGLDVRAGLAISIERGATETRRTDGVDWVARTHLVEADGGEDVPRTHCTRHRWRACMLSGLGSVLRGFALGLERGAPGPGTQLMRERRGCGALSPLSSSPGRPSASAV